MQMQSLALAGFQATFVRRSQMQVKYTRKEGIFAKPVDDAVFLVNNGNQALYQLEDVGAALWRLLESPISIEEAAGIVHCAFPETDKASIDADIQQLFGDLLGHCLITTSG
jgi:hypothetical protein